MINYERRMQYILNKIDRLNLLSGKLSWRFGDLVARDGVLLLGRLERVPLSHLIRAIRL
jgi:hypothetical protein